MKALLVLVAVLGVAAPAQAQVRVVERFAPLTPPVLTPDGLAWVREGPDRSIAVVSRSAAGAQRDLLVLRPSLRGGRRPYFRVKLAADGGLVAAHVVEQAALGGRAPLAAQRQTVWAGRTGGGLELRGGPCFAQFPGEQAYPDIALGGSRYAGLAPGCDGQAITDLATGGSIALPDDSRGYAQEGDFAAWREPAEQLVLLNSATGASWRVPGVGGGEMDVDAAGTVAFAEGLPERADSRLVWTSPGSPRPHRVPGLFGSIGPIAVGDGRAVFVEVPGGEGPTGFNGALRVVDLAGGVRSTVGSGLQGGFGTLGFDGERVAVTAYRCGRVDLIAVPLGSPALHVRQPRRCPLRLLRRPEVDGKRLEVSISCAGYARWCLAHRLRATTLDGRRVLARARWQDAGRARLRLTPAGRRAAERGGLGRIRLSARLSDDGIGEPAAQRLHSGLARPR